MATGTQQAECKCSKCGERFDSVEKLRDHELNCNGKASSPGATKEQIERDSAIEDRFGATDN